MALEMNPEVRAKWTAALRSNRYQKGRSKLRYAEGEACRHCCLGVLCDIAKQDGVLPENYIHWDLGYLPEEVCKWAALRDEDPKLWSDEFGMVTCTEANDDIGLSFAEIADLIDGGAR